MLKVSIIMPVYNKEMYIAKVIQAILNQTFKDFELIIINDGSTDKSFNIIQYYGDIDNRIKIINQKNAGVSAARNAGIEKANGEWIWFVDADDVLDINFLNNVFSFELKDVNLVVGCFNKVFNDHIETISIDEYKIISSNDFPDIFMKYQYENGYWGYLWNKIIRREIITKLNLEFQVGLTLAEDLLFMVNIYEYGCNILSLPCLTMNYTVESINSSKEKKVNYKQQLNIQLKIRKWIIESCKKDYYINFFNSIISRYASYIIFYKFEESMNCDKEIDELINNQIVYNSLTCENVEPIMKLIVKKLKKKRKKSIIL
ncbi:MAG: glycosyltransferase family 2 protein, partial [Erysipelotrichaceae bacterium]|nr:glycosyltransferase family 2 protein [Erysipelotrichaceae bacterium]